MRQHIRFMKEAFEVSKESNCQILQVGCVIVAKPNKDSNKCVIVSACNGTYPKELNCCSMTFDSREEHHSFADKYEFHAEMNAVMKLPIECSRRRIRGNIYNLYITAYVTHYPCNNCIKLLKRAGVNKIYYCEDYKYADKENKYAKDMKIEQLKLEENV